MSDTLSHLSAIAGRACVVNVRGVEVELQRPAVDDCLFVEDYMSWAKKAAELHKKDDNASLMESMQRPMLCAAQCIVACVEGMGVETAQDLITELGASHELVKKCARLCGADRMLEPVLDPRAIAEEEFDDQVFTSPSE